MVANLRQSPNQEPYICINTVLGKLCIFGLNINRQIRLRAKLGQSIEDSEAEKFVRLLSIYICFPESSLKEGSKKPDSPILTEEEVNTLTTDDIEKIAENYIKNNEHLFKESKTTKRKNDKGEMIIHSEYSGVEFPKGETETYTEYLHRLSVKEEIKLQKIMKEFADSVSGLSSFSTSLNESIKKTLSWGDSLSKTIEGLKPVQLSEIRPREMKVPRIDWTEIEKRKEEIRLKPFNELSERLGKLIDLSMQASEFMIEANKIQTRIAGEIKASGDITTIHSKRNISLTIVVIAISLLGLLIAAYPIVGGINNGESKQLEAQKILSEISQKSSELNASITSGNNNISTSVDKLLKELRQSAIKESEYKNIVEEQALELERLRKSDKQQKEMLEKLDSRIRAINNTQEKE